jgi:hypothetical protein
VTYRKGTLYFFNNTVIIRGEKRNRWNTSLFRLETRDETADVRNNIVFHQGSTHVFWLDGPGRLRLGANWVSEGVGERPRPEPGMAPIAGVDRLVVGRDSPFANVDGADLRVRPGSDAARPGDSLRPDVAAEYLPVQAYVPHQKARPLPAGTARTALGALE